VAGLVRWRIVGPGLAGLVAASVSAGCGRDQPPDGAGDRSSVGGGGGGTDQRSALPPPAWTRLKPPLSGQALSLRSDRPRVEPVDQARAAGLLVVDLGDGWTPFIFSEGSDLAGQPRRNPYRNTFIDLANDRVDPNDVFLAGTATRALDLSPEAEEKRRLVEEARRQGKPPPRERPPARRTGPARNHLEVFGIPPTLSVLKRRIDEDAARADCFGAVDSEGLRLFTGAVTYSNGTQAQREHDEAVADAGWLAMRLAQLGDAGPSPDGGLAAATDAGAATALDRLRADPREAARLDRQQRGQRRIRAVMAAQARLVCEGLLTPRSRYVAGVFDRPTHQALAEWERKNDIFGWGFLSAETLAALQRAPLELHFETARRILTERLADAAGIIEDGSVSGPKKPATYRDLDGAPRPVPDLIGEHLQALLAQLQLGGPEDLALFLSTFAPSLGTLQVAFTPPPLPAYYGPHMDLQVEIDRGDVWYDFPFDEKGRPAEQKRQRFPSLTLFVRWNQQRIPMGRWRTTIGSWRSEVSGDGKLYYKYKNSDIGPRIWKYVVAAPVWIPPDGTPARDLLTRKQFDVRVGPVDVVNTDVMGPGFQSAYGLVMAIHHKVTPGGGLFDNQIRTHGSVDYTSIARRFSHGCHRLVNTRAVRLFGFVLRHRTHVRQGDHGLRIKKLFNVDERRFGYELTTRGYYYELQPPLPIEVLEGRVVGNVKKPITAFVPKPGVDYGPSPAVSAAEGAPPPGPIETAPSLGP
jgi:hypothetical protein